MKEKNKLLRTRNIANGGDCSKIKHFSPLRAFISVDTDALRKPPLAILQNVSSNINEKRGRSNFQVGYQLF
jgi:hypothetical protein